MRIKQTFLRLAAALLLAHLAMAARAAELPAAFTDALRQAGIPLDHVAVVVQPLDAATALVSHNADAAMNPASVMKLVTSYAALHQLGPRFSWPTEVWADGPVRDGVLEGDLIVKGYGDPSLTLERVWLLQRELRAHGIRHIRGNLLLDTSHFELPPLDPGAFDGEPLALYNAAPGALVANFNATTLRLKPEGDSLQIVPEIALPGVTMRAEVVLTSAAGCNGWKETVTPAIPDPTRRELVLSGQYPRGCGEQALSLNLFEPAATFDFIFRGLWAESGGTLAGQTLPGMAPASPPLLRVESPPLTDALTSLNKYSNNLMTRNLFLTLGAARFGPPATLDKGHRAVRATLDAQGIATDKLVLENGAGLSRIERISARSLSQLLQAAYASPLFSEFESALPIVAIDGTLKRRFNGSPLVGNAHLKTGTLRDVSALAGYVYSARGRRIAFVMLVNHEHAKRALDAQQQLLEWVWHDLPAAVAPQP
ncbi:D-alanyl-D-alanine carboxypeptidase/D-alanyl-D-alanine-endopeptidase [Thiobacillus sp.]|uniref:D-alanyl-D-alanine carboxypeptidase/D-alanyl-D-alanine endopeptidase n=1 Tax=Thiobacillus sp. TaxID=924 RepID=UPI0025ED0DC0|nr:D-alanyl-D-alanine carboxypeptidase/D-alanyl-D-alanine-endopeptidase [Thiobacillus sp.]MBT9538352.1 D-alanyl-D-alanine carboxypeptidase/D-alanyl-D-alanine-endopeptidase [Thiobacillus sp.]